METNSTVLDDELLRRWRQQRDAEAFAALVQRHAGMVYGTCLRILRNHHSAEDLAQECFLTLTQRPPRSGERLGAWLHTVAVRRSLNRKKSDSRRLLREEATDQTQMDSNSRYEWDEFVSAVDEAIGAVAPDLRELVVMHYLEGKTHMEIAEKLQVPRTTVTSRLRHAVALIRERLDRRGVVATVAAVSEGLVTLRAEAVPATLTPRLGKLALAGRVPNRAPWTFLQTANALRAALPALFMALLIVTTSVVLLNVWGSSRKSASSVNPAQERQVEAPTAPVRNAEPTQEQIAASAAPAAIQLAAADDTDHTTLEVLVLGTDGQPVSGATVVAGSPIRQDDANILPRALTNGEGVASVQAPASGELIVAAYKPGAGWAVTPDGTSAARKISLSLKPFASVAVRLFDKATGQDVRDLTLSFGLWGTESREIPRISPCMPELDASRSKISVDAAGRFQPFDLLPQKYSIYFLGETKYAVPPMPIVDLQPGETRVLEFPLEPGGSIGGVVLDPDGHPLDQVSIHYRPWPHFEFGDRFNILSDADGRFLITGLPAGLKYELAVQHRDFAREVRNIEMPRPADLRDFVIKLSVGRRMTGRITDDGGRPIAGLGIGIQGLTDSVETDAAGNFTFEHVHPGTGVAWMWRDESKKQLLAYDIERVNQTMPKVVVPENADPSPVTIVVPRMGGGFVAGRVVNTAGEPIARMRVRADLRLGRVSDVTTDINGHFRIEGLGDLSKVDVSTFPGDAGYAMAVSEGVPANTLGLTLVVHRMGRIAGRVTSLTNGAPVSSYRIRTSTQVGHGTNHSSWQDIHQAEGRFLFDEVPPGDVTLQIESAGYAPKEISVPEVKAEQTTSDVEIALADGWRGRIRAIDAVSGEVVVGAFARAWTVPADHAKLLTFSTFWLSQVSEFEFLNYPQYSAFYVTPTVTANEDGGANLPLMNVEGPFGVVVWAKGYAPAIRGPLEKNASNEQMTIALDRAAGLRVRVVGAQTSIDNLSFEAVQVDLPVEQEAVLFRCNLQPEHDDSAAYTGLPFGAYGVVVSAREGYERRQLAYIPVSLTAGETAEFEVDLSKLDATFGAVTGTVDTALPIYVVFTRQQPGRTVEVVGSAPVKDGAFHAAGLPAGPATMRITWGDDRYERPIVISTGTTQSVAIDLP